MERHYARIIMQAVVVEMLWNGSGIPFCLCSGSFIWVPVVARWWSAMVCSLDLKSLCLELSHTVEGSYSCGRYSTQSSYGGYSRDSGDGGSGRGCSGTRGGGHDGERYTDGGSYDGYSGDGGYSYGSTGSCSSFERGSYGGTERLYLREVYDGTAYADMLKRSIIINKYMTEQKMTFARSFKFTCNDNYNISNYPLPVSVQCKDRYEPLLCYKNIC